MIDERLEKRIVEALQTNLKESRRIHTYAVVREAEKLAELYGADVDTARTAALFHDMYKNLSQEDMNMYIRQWSIGEQYIDNANLAHSKIAAAAMRKYYDIKDEDMINAVSYHTTGRAGMSLLEKIIFIADAIEPGRKYAGVENIRKEAYVDIDRACMLSLEGTVTFLKEKGAYIDPDTLEALEYLKEQNNL